MKDSPILNPGLRANEIASPDNPHTEPSFVRPTYGEEAPAKEEKAKAPGAKKKPVAKK